MANFDQLFRHMNWQQPWYTTLYIPSLSDTFYQVKDWLNASLNNPIYNTQCHAIKFVTQDSLPSHTAYESFIAQGGQIPTRDNYHDLLGGLIWLNYPKIKAVLNHLHTLDIIHNGITCHRSALRNALTLFDENGGIVVSSNPNILRSLQNFDWENVLFHQCERWQPPSQCVQFFPFGHALLEKLITPRKNICSHVLLVLSEQEFFELPLYQQRQKIDALLAKRLLAEYEDLLVSKNFQPLPVLGIANFCQENRQLEFYQDKQVFRPPREQKAMILYL